MNGDTVMLSGDDRVRNLLYKHKSSLIHELDAVRTLPFLSQRRLLSQAEERKIRGSKDRMFQTELLIEIVASKGMLGFKGLCAALERINPALLTCLLLDERRSSAYLQQRDCGDGAADSVPSVRGDYTQELQRRYEEVLREREAAEQSSAKLRADLEDALKRAEAFKTERDKAVAELSNVNKPTTLDENRDNSSLHPYILNPHQDFSKDFSTSLGGKHTLGVDVSHSLKPVENGLTGWPPSYNNNDVRTSQLLQPDINATAGRITWETHVVNLTRTPSHGIGIAITGGRDNPLNQNNGDQAVYISDVVKWGPSEGKLVVGDKVLSVNGVSFDNIEHATAVVTMREGGNAVNIVVQRKVIIAARIDSEQPFKVILMRKKKKDDVGLSVGSRLYIKNIRPGSIAALQGDLKEGDHIIRINNVPADTLSLAEVRRIFDKSSKDKISLIVSRSNRSTYPTPATSAVPSSHHSAEDVRPGMDNMERKQDASSSHALPVNDTADSSKFNQTQHDSLPRHNPSHNRGPQDTQQYPPQYPVNGGIHYNDNTEPSGYNDVQFPERKQNNEPWIDGVQNIRAYPPENFRNVGARGMPPFDDREPINETQNTPLNRGRPFGYMDMDVDVVQNGVPDYNRVSLRSEQGRRGFDPRGLRPTSELIPGQDYKRPYDDRVGNLGVGRVGSTKGVGSPLVEDAGNFPRRGLEDDYIPGGSGRLYGDDVSPYRRSAIPDREPRLVSFRKEGGVGIRISGGNRTGIFVAKVAPNTPAEMQGLCEGDLILKVNEKETRGMTREEAVLLLLGLRDQVHLLVQQCRPEYERLMAEGGTGDLFHIRTHFTYSDVEHGEMSFQNGDIFQVTDTLYSGVVGSWQASLLRGHKGAKKGIIPNLSRAEQLAIAQDSNNKENSAAPPNGARSAQRSSSGFFKKKTAIRAKSLGKDNWDDMVLGRKPENSPVSKQGSKSTKFSAYERVVLRDAGFIRPVVIFGPLADVARQKLVQDLPEWFESPYAEGKQDQDRGTRSGIIKLRAIQHIIDKRKHGVLDVTPSAVDRLNYAQYAPIVIYLKAESKQAVKELRHHWLKHSSKNHRKLFEQSEKLERTFSHLFTYTIPLTNGEGWYRKLKESVDKAQKERVWMSEFKPSESIKDDLLYHSHRHSFLSSLESEIDANVGYFGADYDLGTPLPGTPVGRAPRGYYDMELGGSGFQSLGYEGRGRLVRSSSDPSIATLDNVPTQLQPRQYEQQSMQQSSRQDGYEPYSTYKPNEYVDHLPSGQPGLGYLRRDSGAREPPSLTRVQSEYGQRRFGGPVYRGAGDLPPYRSNIDPYATLTPSERVRLQQQTQLDSGYSTRERPEVHQARNYQVDPYLDQFPPPPPMDELAYLNQGSPGQYNLAARPGLNQDQVRSVPDLHQPIRKDYPQHQPMILENTQQQQPISFEYAQEQAMRLEQSQQQPIRIENRDAEVYWRNGERERQYMNLAPIGSYYPDQPIAGDDRNKFNSLSSAPTMSGRYEGSGPYYQDVRGNTIHQSIRNINRPKTAEYGQWNNAPGYPLGTDYAGRQNFGFGSFQSAEPNGMRAKSETNLATQPEPPQGGRAFQLEKEQSNPTRAHYLYDRPYSSVHQSSDNINKPQPASNSSDFRPSVPPPKPPHLNDSSGGIPGKNQSSGKSTGSSTEGSRASEMKSEPDERRSSAFESYRKFFENNAAQNINNNPSSSTNNIINKSPIKGSSSTDSEGSQTVVATARGVFDCNGGVLESKETGVSIIVPKGAIPENVRQEIYFKVCRDGSIVPPLDEKKGETLLSPLVMCGPHGLKFQRPVELRLPHSASINPESWSFALKSSDSPIEMEGKASYRRQVANSLPLGLLPLYGQPTHWHNMSLADNEGMSQGKVTKNCVSVMVDHF